MGSGLRQDDNHSERICPKIADDFAAKSADNGRGFRTRRPAGHFGSDQREDTS
jgi:hypothetical protein